MSAEKKGIRVTGAGESSSSTKKARLKKSGLRDLRLRVLNDRVLIEEDPIDWHNDPGSGLTKEVVAALKDSKLVIPDTAEFYAKKYPCTGTVVHFGPSCNGSLSIGDHVIFARMGVMRIEMDGKRLAVCTLQDIHAVID